ncbi:alpha/beta hydrolase family protein [Nonomuraea sediminis]|uniref:alpha/beta hydrolase family protein n=1 Tax=Nonomuraea sediminis TaxID=2835864 RepID=UPI001BDBF6A5|nr:lipase [Nonomuraea sediminis]
MRTRLLALVAAVTLPIVSGCAGDPPAVLTLPAPTGPHPIGTLDLHLVDSSRPDPYEPGRRRELMVSLWYPARDGKQPFAPYLAPKAAARFIKANGLTEGSVRLPVTHARTGSPVLGGKLPVVLFSPGNGANRSDSTVVVEELASRGYLVVTVDHTHDAEEVEFPDGRLATHTMPAETPGEAQVAVRSADVRFVLDRLADLDGGGNPDVERRALPEGVKGAFDLGRVGMFGHSMGGAATATTMLEDPRIKAGLSLDGPVFGEVARKGVAVPYLLMSAKAQRALVPELAAFRGRLRGWKLNVKAEGAAHVSFSDAEVLYPQAAKLLGWGAPELRKQIGTLDPARGLAIQRAYPVAFFDRFLKSRPSPLLDGPSKSFPEITFIP